MVAFVRKEWRNTSHITDCVVEGKLGKGEERGPVVLSIGAEGADDLFKGLVDSFCLTIGFRMVSGGEVQVHVQCFSKRAEEDGNELRPSVGSDVSWYSMLGEDISNEEFH